MIFTVGATAEIKRKIERRNKKKMKKAQSKSLVISYCLQWKYCD